MDRPSWAFSHSGIGEITQVKWGRKEGVADGSRIEMEGLHFP
jgi:hypothetical protein